MGIFGANKTADDEGQMELVEHLGELRTRIFRMLLYIFGGMGVAWFLYEPIGKILNRPIQPVLDKVGGETVMNSIPDGFLLQLQTSFITGLILAAPLVISELWGFIRPALTDDERKPMRVLAPLSVLLFAAGVVTAYAALPAAYGWMASYVTKVPEAKLLQNAKDYMLLTAKIMLAFGLSFELPVILLFLAKINLLTSTIMTTYWRHAVVIIAALAAIFAPSNEPVTMLLMAIPMVALYLASIAMVRAMEPNEDGSQRSPFVGLLLIFLAPALILAAASFWLWKNPPPPRPATPPTATETKTNSEVKTLAERVEFLEKQLAELKTELKKPAAPALSVAPAPKAK